MSSQDPPPPEKWLLRLRSRAISVFITCGVLLFLASAALLVWDVCYEAFGNVERFKWERLSILLIVPAAICFFVASVLYAWKEWASNAWRHVAYQIAAFLILGLSLRAFGLHNPVDKLLGEAKSATHRQESAEPNDAGREELKIDAAKSIAEMAAIMVLFVLAELAAFVGHDTNKATKVLGDIANRVSKAAERANDAAALIATTLRTLEETTDRIRQLRLVANIATLHQDVQEHAVDVVHAWGERVPARKRSESSVTDVCWQTLLREYLKEELLDIAPKSIEHEGIPRSVRPLHETKPSDVSFVATNVAFYAKFLSSLVDELSSTASVLTGSKLCMAIVTNALPAHCWNWPLPDGEWRSYGPIDAYRSSMLTAVERGAQIDRVLLVYDDTTELNLGLHNPAFFDPYQGVFWRAKLLDQMLSSWFKLSPQVEGDEKVKCSQIFAQERGEIGTVALPSFPAPVRKAALQTVGSIYPIIINGNGMPAVFKDQVLRQWECKRLSDEYKSLHGERGMFWKLALNTAKLDHFEGRHDMMFIGLGKGNSGEAGLWTSVGSCNWGICLMSSMNATTQTMFLTVLSGEAVQVHYNWCRDQLNDSLKWSSDRLHPAT